MNFRPFSAFHLDIGCAPNVLTINATPTGEHGYVFYIPNEFAVHIYDEIMAAGKEHGIEQCGWVGKLVMLRGSVLNPLFRVVVTTQCGR